MPSGRGLRATQPAVPPSTRPPTENVSEVPGPTIEPPEPSKKPVVMTADGVDQLVESRSREIERCYDESRKVQPELSGKLIIKVTVAGPRIRATIHTNELNPEIGGCVLRAIRTITPPENTGEPVTILKEILFRVKNI